MIRFCKKDYFKTNKRQRLSHMIAKRQVSHDLNHALTLYKSVKVSPLMLNWKAFFFTLTLQCPLFRNSRSLNMWSYNFEFLIVAK